MSKKIKIMNPKPELSDSEIDRYMNFQDLLHKGQLASSAKKMKRWIWTGGIALIAMLSVLYFTLTPDPTAVNSILKVNSFPIPAADSVGRPHDDETTTTTPPEATPDRVRTSARLPKKEMPAADKRSSTNAPTQVDVYVQAEPVDGYNILYSYLNSNVRYPGPVGTDSIQGIVTVSFIIDKNGLPTTIEATSSLPGVFNEEAIRLIRNMPAWRAATLNGKPVQSKISLPVTFQIQSFQKK
jgi:TonB family protein